MGFMLWVAGAAVLAALYIPGFLLVRGFGASRMAAVLCAPMVMVGLYVLLGMALQRVGVFATGPVLAGCALVLSAAVYGPGRLARRRSRRKSFQAVALPCEEAADEAADSSRTDWALLAFYLVLGIGVTAFMTVSGLTSPESIVQEYDNVHHLGVAQAFLQSGIWSPFAANLYTTPDAAAFNPLPVGGFYPTAWSMLVAMASGLTGCSVALAANAVNCAIAGVLYPISLFFLMRVLFPNRRGVIAAGSVVMLASTQFPWALMIFGPLYPNMLAYALMPAVVACFVCWLGPVRAFPRKGDAFDSVASRHPLARSAVNRHPLARPAAHGRWFLLMLAGMVTCVFSQPNAVFSLGVFLVPFIVAKAYGHGRRKAARSGVNRSSAAMHSVCSDREPIATASACPDARSTEASHNVDATAESSASTPLGRGAGWRWAVIACVLIALAWVVVFNVPMIQAVASFEWPATKIVAQAVREAGLFMFRFSSFTVLLTLFVWVGIARTLKHRRWLWVSCSFVLLSVLYVVAQTVDGPVKALLTGFWYTDSLRLAAAAVVFAMPLAALGFDAAVRLLASLMTSLSARLFRSGRSIQPRGEACKSGRFVQKNSRTCRFCGLRAGVGAVLAAVFLVTSFGPSVPLGLGPLQNLGPDDQWFKPSSGVGAAVESLASMTDGAQSRKLSNDERDFIRQVQQLVPADAPIANLPFDGSAWAYGAMGLNDYYRYIGTYGVEGETPESRLIRRHLNEYATNPDVQAAVEKLGIRYVLQLDQGAPAPKPRDTAFLHAVEDGFDWSGLTAIDDDTPGFTPVLSRGDMRLYEIG